MRGSRGVRARAGVLASLLLAASFHRVQAAPCTAMFAAATSHAAGSAPQAIALGDLDADGRLDLVAANGSANAFTVCRGIAGGGFGAAVSTTAGTNPRALALADLDEDGRLDLLLGTTGGVQHWRGLGTGSFTLVATLDGGTSSRAIVAADLDADGVLDVASANSAANEIVVLRALSTDGRPTGGFAPAVRYAVGTAPGRLVACDLDGDGALDLVSADNSGGTVSVLRGRLAGGRPDGTFAAVVKTTVGGNPAGLASGDVDGDGRVDLVVTHGGGTTLTVLRGTAAGGFALSTYVAPLTSRDVALADVDGDGIADAVMVSTANSQLAVMSGTAAGGFSAARLWSAGSSPTTLVVTDLDGDRRPDAVTGNSGAASVSRLMGICAAGTDDALALTSPAAGASWWPGLPQRVRWQRGAAVTAVDLELSGDDGATWLPLATSLPGTEAVVFAPPPVTAAARLRVRDRVVRSRMTASVSPFSVCGLFAGPVASAAGLPSAKQLVVADLDGDGLDDAAIASATAIATARGTGGGAFALWGLTGAAAPRALAAADLDRDGRAELLALESGGLIVRPDGALAPGAGRVVAVAGFGEDLAVADLDGDGDLDVAVVTSDGALGRLQVFMGDGDGALALETTVDLATPGSRVLAADLDADGAPELTLTTSGALEVWKLAAGTWVRTSERLLAAPVGDLALGDFDRDGVLDLAACLGATGDIWRFRGTGSGFGSPSAFHAGASPAHAAATDWDGDGFADLVLASAESPGVAVLLGDALPGAAAGSFLPVTRHGDAATSGAALALADLTGDGSPDVLLATADGRLELRPSQCAPKLPDTLAWSSAPAAAASLEPGAEVALSWVRGPAVPQVALDLSRDDGAHWEPLTPVVAGSSWRWRVSGPAASRARLRVRDGVVPGRAAVTAAFAITGALLDAAPSSPSGLALSAPVPAPTRGGTTLQLSLPAAGHVRAELLDVNGRLVRMLADAPLGAGVQALRWDGLDAEGRRPAPGMLFVRVQSGGGQCVRRIALVR